MGIFILIGGVLSALYPFFLIKSMSTSKSENKFWFIFLACLSSGYLFFLNLSVIMSMF